MVAGITRTVAPELARMALITIPPFPIKLPTCARGTNNRQIGVAPPRADPPLASPSPSPSPPRAAVTPSSPVIVSNILNSATSAVVIPSPSSPTVRSSPLATNITRSSAPRVVGATLTRAPVSARVALITRPSFPITRPILVVGHSNRYRTLASRNSPSTPRPARRPRSPRLASRSPSTSPSLVVDPSSSSKNAVARRSIASASAAKSSSAPKSSSTMP